MKTKILSVLVAINFAACDATNDSAKTANAENDELHILVAISEGIQVELSDGTSG